MNAGCNKPPVLHRRVRNLQVDAFSRADANVYHRFTTTYDSLKKVVAYSCGILLFAQNLNLSPMYWTLELVSWLDDAPWPATKDELIDYAIRSGAPLEVIENLQELEDDGEPYESIEEIWSDYPTNDDYFFNEDEL